MVHRYTKPKVLDHALMEYAYPAAAVRSLRNVGMSHANYQSELSQPESLKCPIQHALAGRSVHSSVRGEVKREGGRPNADRRVAVGNRADFATLASNVAEASYFGGVKNEAILLASWERCSIRRHRQSSEYLGKGLGMSERSDPLPGMLAARRFEPYIHHIRFPHFRNLGVSPSFERAAGLQIHRPQPARTPGPTPLQLSAPTHF